MSTKKVNIPNVTIKLIAFQKISKKETEALKARAVIGNSMKQENRNILTAYEGLEIGDSFPIPVPPEFADKPTEYKKRVMAFLAAQDHKDRDVYVHPDDNGYLIVERLAEARTRSR